MKKNPFTQKVVPAQAITMTDWLNMKPYKQPIHGYDIYYLQQCQVVFRQLNKEETWFKFYGLSQTQLKELTCQLVSYFEDYINDTKNNNSMYRTKEDIAKVLSWLSTAAIMSWIAAKFDPSDIPRLESQLALITWLVSWTLIWPRVEARIMNMTADHKLQFKERYYNYERKKSTTWTRYGGYWRRQRNKSMNKKWMSNLKPDQMWVVIDSKSQKIRFRFNKKQFLECKGHEKINILKVKLCKEYIKEFYEKWVIIWVHIKFGEKSTYLPFIDKRIELIQTLLLTDSKVRIWCVPESKSKEVSDPDEDIFQDGFMEVRDTVSFHRAKYYKSFDTESRTIIQYAQAKENKIGENNTQLELFQNL